MDRFKDWLGKQNPNDFDEAYYMFLNNLTYENLSEDHQQELKLLNNPSASSPLKRKRAEDCEQEVDKKQIVEPEKEKEMDSKGKKMETEEEDSREEELGEFGLTTSEGDLLRNIFRAYETKQPPFRDGATGDDMDVDGKQVSPP